MHWFSLKSPTILQVAFLHSQVSFWERESLTGFPGESPKPICTHLAPEVQLSQWIFLVSLLRTKTNHSISEPKPSSGHTVLAPSQQEAGKNHASDTQPGKEIHMPRSKSKNTAMNDQDSMPSPNNH